MLHFLVDTILQGFFVALAALNGKKGIGLSWSWRLQLLLENLPSSIAVTTIHTIPTRGKGSWVEWRNWRTGLSRSQSSLHRPRPRPLSRWRGLRRRWTCERKCERKSFCWLSRSSISFASCLSTSSSEYPTCVQNSRLKKKCNYTYCTLIKSKHS